MTANPSTPLLSVVLATYNPRADYLQRVVDGLEAQTLPRGRWEFVVVDNNSQPPLRVSIRHTADGSREEERGQGSEIGEQSSDARQGDLKFTNLKHNTPELELGWHPRARLVVETQQGLSHARRRGFEEAKADLIVNLDDDVVLDPDYLEQVVALAERFPSIGAFGCQIHGEFETDPVWPRQEYYGAERLVESDVWSNIGDHFASTPGGAGSVVRRNVARAYVKKMSSDHRWGLLGRSAGKWLSCEDIEIAMLACDLGLGKGVFRSLSLTHLIPASKMTEEFQCKNAYGNGYSSVVHHYLRHGVAPRRPRLLARVDRLYRLMRMSPRKRREEMSKDRGLRDARRLVAELKMTERASQKTEKVN